MILTLKEKQVFLDDEDWEKLRQFKFTIIKSRNTYYCRKTTGACDMMHRLIMGLVPNDPIVVDHINGNGLDNRKVNLRLADHSTNAHNVNVKGKSEIPFIGVFRDKNKFRATIRVKGKRISLGSFSHPIQAALAYDQAAKKYFGDFACRLNKEILATMSTESLHE